MSHRRGQDYDRIEFRFGARYRVAAITAIGSLAVGMTALALSPASAQTALCQGHPVTVNLGAGESATDGDDVILGTAAGETINGLDGDDIICALGGNDNIFGGAGNDLIYGGGGNDWAAGGLGVDTIFGQGGGDLLYGGGGNDQVVGGPGDDVIFGGAGDDNLQGAGSDGGDGIDVCHDQAGTNLITGCGDGGLKSEAGGSEDPPHFFSTATPPADQSSLASHLTGSQRHSASLGELV